MRLGIVATSYPRFAGDPAGSFVEAHARALIALGHTVDVVAADRGVPAGDLFYTGGAPDRIERAPLRSIIDGVTFTTRLAREVRRRSHAWDAIIAHWLPAALAALPARLPILAIAHGGDVHTLRRFGLLRPTLALLRSAQLACVSTELQQLCGGFVQPMGIDLAHFARIARTPTTPPTILVVARLVPVKGVDVAIAALREIDRDVRLVVAGDGPERYANDPRVHFVGEVTAGERDRLLGEASVVVIPSRILPNGRTEGTPMIALEALAANVPVVASAVGGLRELSAIRTVPPDDPSALARAIVTILDDPPRHLRDAVAHLDWSLVAPRLVPKL